MLCLWCDMEWSGWTWYWLVVSHVCCFFQLCTNVILVIRHYPNLCRDTCFVTGVDKKHRNTTCPNLQCFGCNEGCISPWFPSTIRGRRHCTICWQGKVDLFFKCWKVLEELDPDNDKVQALSQLGVAEHLSEATINVIEAFVCQLYLPHTELTECSRCKLVAFQEETGAIWAPPLKLHFIQL